MAVFLKTLWLIAKPLLLDLLTIGLHRLFKKVEEKLPKVEEDQK